MTSRSAAIAIVVLIVLAAGALYVTKQQSSTPVSNEEDVAVRGVYGEIPQ